jgi:alkylation response protein AidB-like acyl-CoA dehydrogenase
MGCCQEPTDMDAVLADPTTTPAAAGPAPTVRSLIAKMLAPQVLDIDTKGTYPEAFLRALGAAGGYAGAMVPRPGWQRRRAAPRGRGDGRGLAHLHGHRLHGLVPDRGRALPGHVQQRCELKAEFLPRIAPVKCWWARALSNTVKSCDAIEESRLKAVRVEGGYRVTGVLPWVSNLGEGHFFATGCPVEGADCAQRVFFLVDCSAPDFKMVECATFVALEGTRTLACQFRDTFIADARVLAHPADSLAYIRRIKPGMVLAQMGMGLGLIDACIQLMRDADRTHAHVNQFLDDRPDELQPLLDGARAATLQLADTITANPTADVILDILKLRLAGGELSLRAAHSAMLHQGAKGYLLRNAAQRRLREAYFVAIVTPAIKHLRKEIARIEAGCVACADEM